MFNLGHEEELDDLHVCVGEQDHLHAEEMLWLAEVRLYCAIILELKVNLFEAFSFESSIPFDT